MEIRIERDEFYRSIYRVQSIIEKRSNMPILSMILCPNNSLYVICKDLAFLGKGPYGYTRRP